MVFVYATNNFDMNLGYTVNELLYDTLAYASNNYYMALGYTANKL